jgi:methionine-gamma-lyase
MIDRKRLATLCAQAGATEEHRVPDQPVIPAIDQSTVFYLGTTEQAEDLFSGRRKGYAYTRFANPTVDRLAEVFGAMEGGHACVTASGNAATVCAVLMALRGADDRVVASSDIYGGSLEAFRLLQEKLGVAVEIVDAGHAERWAEAVRHASVVFVETPSNPLLRLIDIQATADMAHDAGAKLIVDNTVATPYNQLPLSLGADYVVHSVSKYLNGHSDIIGGCVVAKAPLTAAEKGVHKNLGGTFNAMDAWLALRGLRTFTLRMEAHNRNGAEVAAFLSKHPAIKKVHYPGLPDHPQAALFRKQMQAGGALLSFSLHGGAEAANRFLDSLKLIVHAVSLGGMESLATRPAATSHRGMTPEQRQAAGVDDGLVRLSVGTEAVDDILHDLEQALASLPIAPPA